MFKQLLLISFFIPVAINASGANANATASACTSSAADDKARADEKSRSANALTSAAADQKETSAQSIVDWLQTNGQERMSEFEKHGQGARTAGNLWVALVRAHSDLSDQKTDPKFIDALMLAEQQSDRLAAAPLIMDVIANRVLGAIHDKSPFLSFEKLSVDMLQYLTRQHLISRGRGAECGETYAHPNCRLVLGDHDDGDWALDNDPFSLIVHAILSSACSGLQAALEKSPLPKVLWPMILGYTRAFGVDRGNVVVDLQLPVPGISIRDMDHYCTIEPLVDTGHIRWLSLSHKKLVSYDGLHDVVQNLHNKGSIVLHIDLHGNRLTKIGPDISSHRPLTLDLSNNHISEIETGFQGVSHLILRENRLQTLPTALMDEGLLKDLRSLDLRGNPLVDDPLEMQKVKMLRERGVRVETDPTQRRKQQKKVPTQSGK